MATIRPGPLVSSVRGTIGGVTFTRSRAGAVARIHVKPKNPWSAMNLAGGVYPSSSQNYHRAEYSILRDRWTSALTQTQRDGWDAKAAALYFRNALGDDSHLPGLSLYLFVNLTRRSVRWNPIDTVPVHPVAPMPASYAEWDPVNHIFKVYTETLDPVLVSIVRFQLSPALSMGVNYFTDPWVYSGLSSIQPPPGFVYIPFLAHGPLPECRKFFIRLRGVTFDGGVTFPLIIPAVSTC